MSFTDGSSNMVMPVTSMPGGGYYGGGNMFGGNGDGAWWILILLLALRGGWDNGNNCGSGNGGGSVYPYLLNTQTQNDVNRGFADANLASQFGSLQSTLYSNQIANMNQRFSDVVDIGNRLDAIVSSLQQCCCDNRASIADLKYTVATENCADRYEAAQNTRDIIDAINNKSQLIQDKLCQLELDGFKRENDNLRTQLNNALIANGLNNEVDALYNRLKNCPVPSMPVYGQQPIFTCGGNVGCGCNGGSF